MPIFNIEVLRGREVELAQELADMCSAPIRSLAALDELDGKQRALVDAVSLARGLDAGVPISDCSFSEIAIETFPGEIVPMLHGTAELADFLADQGRIGAYLVAKRETQEQSLLFVIAGEHGAFACLRGLVTESRDVYALQMVGNGSGAGSMLLSALSPPMMLEDSIMTFSPVTLPSKLGSPTIAIRKACDMVGLALHGRTERRNGVIRWESPGVLSELRQLAHDGWWQQVPAATRIATA